MNKKFKTKYDKHDRKIMNHGEENIRILKARKKDGSIVVDDTGKKFNLKEYINSYADSVNINILLKRFAAGDQSVMQDFNKVFADFVDYSDIPDNFIEQMEFVNRTEATFEALPAEIKEKFGNSFVTFANKAGTDEFNEILGVKNEGKVSKPAEEIAGDTPTAKE